MAESVEEHISWADRAAMGDFTHRPFLADGAVLGPYLSTWQGLLSSHEANVRQLLTSLTREQRSIETLRNQIDQGLDLLQANGAAIEPEKYDAALLDMLDANRKGSTS